MNNMMWLMRAVQWVRNPPSARRVWLVVGVITAVIALGTVEWMGWWPQWATVDHRPGRMLRP